MVSIFDITFDQVGSAPTFGARLNMAKVRNCANFKICWRVKCFGLSLAFPHN